MKPLITKKVREVMNNGVVVNTSLVASTPESIDSVESEIANACWRIVE